VQSLKSLAPGFISVDDSTVMLDSNVDTVLDISECPQVPARDSRLR
jgi:hypothetical protein